MHTQCISHPPLCARLLPRYIRLNCIYAEDCSRMIYVLVNSTQRLAGRYRISRLPNDDHTATRETLYPTFSSSFRFLSRFSIFHFFHLPSNQVPRIKFTRVCGERRVSRWIISRMYLHRARSFPQIPAGTLLRPEPRSATFFTAVRAAQQRSRDNILARLHELFDKHRTVTGRGAVI